LAKLEEVAQIHLGPGSAPALVALVAERAVDLNLDVGDVAAARRWADEYERSAGQQVPAAIGVRLAEAEERPDLLEFASAALGVSETDPQRIDTLLTAARIAWIHGDNDRSREWVARAISIAEPEGLVRRFCEAGSIVGNVLSDLVERPHASWDARAATTLFLARLQAACSRSRPVVGAASPTVVGLVEQLSPREVEVLRQLATGRSYTEIGSTLFVSRNTVKSHVRHVYTKLGVASRADAVNVAGQLGVL
jgi:LuxR family maltose regulon positive regulatory protein